MARLNVMRWGLPSASKTMVALHGITANGGAMAELARALVVQGWQVLAPDMRGHGESTRADGDFSFDSLLADIAESVPVECDVLLGHSFGGTLAQLGVLRGLFRPRALLLEDPVSHFADKQTPKAMLDWDEANIPLTVEGILQLNPGWSELDAAWKLLSLKQVSFDDARAAFSGNAPWDLRDDAAAFVKKLPTIWVLPEDSRFVPDADVERLRREAGEEAVVVVPNAGHSIHRDATARFVEIVEHLSKRH